MDAPLLKLYPPPAEECSLVGAYLAHGLNQRGNPERPYVYTNFVVSLDGRVSEVDPERGDRRPPRAIVNPRDWRLYLELAAQADAILIAGRRLRELTSRGGAIDCVGEAQGDLGEWRAAHGLPPHPACLVLSRGLDFPPEALASRRGEIVVLTGSEAASPVQAAALQAAGIEVVRGSDPWVTAREIEAYARRRRFRALYAIGGPRVLHTLLRGDRLDRLYLTQAHVALGGRTYDSLLHGARLSPPFALRLNELYLDRAQTGVPESMYLCFDRAPPV